VVHGHEVAGGAGHEVGGAHLMRAWAGPGRGCTCVALCELLYVLEKGVGGVYLMRAWAGPGRGCTCVALRELLHALEKGVGGAPD